MGLSTPVWRRALNKHQAGMAIEDVVRQRASTELRQLAVDTHRFTDFAMPCASSLDSIYAHSFGA